MSFCWTPIGVPIESSQFAALTLEMCDKGALDKAYCEDFKKKQEHKAKDEKKDSEPAK